MNAEPSLLLNGSLVPAAQARISALADGFQAGYGAFETMRAARGRLAFFEDHAARLTRAATTLGLRRPDAEAARDGCRRVLAAFGGGPAALKWILFRDATGGTGEVIAPRAFPYRDEHYARGFALCSVAALGGFGLKSLSRLPYQLALRSAREAGADEALLVDPAEEVLEGSFTNVFLVESGILLTPPLDGRILPGIARARVVRLGSAHEGLVTRRRLLEADEVFVTNALLGVMPVARLDERTFSLENNPVTRELRRLYEAEAAGSLVLA